MGGARDTREVNKRTSGFLKNLKRFIKRPWEKLPKILLFLLFIMIFYFLEDTMSATIKFLISLCLLVVGAIIMYSSVKKLGKCGKAKLVYICREPFLACIFILVFCASVSLVAAGVEIVRTQYFRTPIAEDGEKIGDILNEKTDGDKEEVSDNCNPTVYEFVWENDPFVDMLDSYYSKKIVEKEKKEYIERLLINELSNLKGRDMIASSVLNSSEYGNYIARANEYFDMYIKLQENSSMSDYLLVLLELEYECRMDADKYCETALNLEMLGHTMGHMALWDSQNEEECYRRALIFYIRALKCAVMEKNSELGEEIMKYITDMYRKIVFAEGCDKVMVDVCEQMQERVADIIGDKG